MKRFEAIKRSIHDGAALGRQRRQRAFDTCICDPLDNRRAFVKTSTNLFISKDVEMNPVKSSPKNSPAFVLKIFRNLVEFESLPQFIIESGVRYEKDYENIFIKKLPFAICLRNESLCNACSCAETICKYRRDKTFHAIYRRTI